VEEEAIDSDASEEGEDVRGGDERSRAEAQEDVKGGISCEVQDENAEDGCVVVAADKVEDVREKSSARPSQTLQAEVVLEG
jgi:hypothetical protein